MANIRLATATANRVSDQIVAAIDGARAGAGKIEFYTGPQPDWPDDPVVSQVLLAQLSFSHPSFARAIDGLISARAIDQPKALARGKAEWVRITDGAGLPVLDCDVGTSDATINLDNDQLVPGGPVMIMAFSIAMPCKGKKGVP